MSSPSGPDSNTSCPISGKGTSSMFSNEVVQYTRFSYSIAAAGDKIIIIIPALCPLLNNNNDYTCPLPFT